MSYEEKTTAQLPITILCPDYRHHHHPVIVIIMSAIGIEGNIGVGKSTLTFKLSSEPSCRYRTLPEKVDRGFLQLFYNDPVKYGFAFQYAMLCSRMYQEELVRRTDEEDDDDVILLWDRTVIGDLIFALWNWVTGSINDAELDVYIGHMVGKRSEDEDGWLSKLHDLTFLFERLPQSLRRVVYLDDSPEACRQRALDERGHSEERDIPLWYFHGLDQMHFHVLRQLLATQGKVPEVCVLTFAQFRDDTLAFSSVPPIDRPTFQKIARDWNATALGCHWSTEWPALRQDRLQLLGMKIVDPRYIRAFWNTLANRQQ